MTKMVAGPTRAVALWIKEAMMDHLDTTPCKSMACVHITAGREVEVVTQTFGEKVWEVEDLANFFIHRAENHVSEIPGTHLFTLYAFYGNIDQPGARRNFRINNAEVEFGQGMTEPPTEQGGRSQMMRQNEIMFQNNLKNSQYIMSQQATLINTLGNLASKLMNDSHQVLEVAKTTILERANVEAEKRIQEADRADRKEFIKMLPVAINRATGMDIFPEAEVKNRMFESMLEKLDTPEKLEMFAAIFGPEAASMVTMYKAKELESKERAISVARQVGIANADSELDTE